MPSALVSGASVAGPTLAMELARSGWDVTVVERAPELREAGQNVDVRGVGREVARRLGVEDAILAANTTAEGTAFVDADGTEVSRFDETDDRSPTAELEVLRGHLARVLADACPDAVEWVFGDHVEAVDDDRVTFASGTERRFDVVAVAEGQRSSTRDALFDDVQLRRLGVDIAYLTVPRTDADDRLWRIFTPGGRRQVSLRPDDVGTTRAMLAFQTEDGLGGRSRDEQTAALRERFAGAGWETDRILAHLDADDWYYESLTQVVCPAWSRGRVVLLGDAAHCVTPLAGLGTSLAMAGGYVLARELATAPDHATAFERYEARMRPFVEDKQDLPPGVPGLAYPESEWGARLLRLGTKAAASRLGRKLVSMAPSDDGELELPPAR